MQSLPPALEPLAAYRQFILFKLVPKNDGTGKTDKLPVDHRTGRVMIKGADWQADPATWTDAQQAITIAGLLGADHGVGFLFTDLDPFFFIDLDGCQLPNGQWSQTATEVCGRLPGAAIEVSQSGKGLHIIGCAAAVPPHGCKNAALGLEMYHSGRFVALTGYQATGSAGTDLTAYLPGVVADYFPPAGGSSNSFPAEWTTTARPEYTGPLDDGELIALMLKPRVNAGQIFGNKASITDLWRCNVTALSRAYPDHYGNRPYDESSADAGLASHLAFWTGCNADRMLRLMWQSGLVRGKWTEHETYLTRTILSAAGQCREVYSAGSDASSDVPPPPTMEQIQQSGLALPFLAESETFAYLGGRPARLLRFNAAWLTRTDQGYYREISDEVVRAEIREIVDWKVSQTRLNNAVDEIKSAVILDSHGVTLPHWIDKNESLPDAGDLIVCKNGILDPNTGYLYPHTDNLLTYNALPYNYDVTAMHPVIWINFLNQVFDNNREAIHELQKLFGYLTTLDTSQQKIFLFIGPKRSGKGTLARVIRAMIGANNVCAPSLNTIANDKGLESLIGKQVAIFPDARLGFKTDKAVTVERLLSISGEDAIDIPRKYQGDWHGQLYSRLIMMSNEVPILGDVSGALMGRYVIFKMPNSFYGYEDKNLTDKLLAELPGILNWSLEGLRELKREGHISTPRMSKDLVDEVDSLGSPVKGFVKEMCWTGENYFVEKTALWSEYKKWHYANGVSGHPLSKEVFGRHLNTAYPGQFKDHRPGGKERERYWSGIALITLAGQVFGEHRDEHTD